MLNKENGDNYVGEQERKLFPQFTENLNDEAGGRWQKDTL